MTKLTARQQQVFDLIRRAIERTGFPPTRAEIAAELGFSSANSAEEHLRALARKGVIELAAGASRGIRLLSGSDDSPYQFTLPHSSIMQLSLPLIGRVAAGSPILAQEHISQHYACDPALFSSKPDYLLKVRGLSMRDAGIFDGDLLAVQKKSEAKDGQIIVARIGDDVTVKRLKRRPDGIELIAENPDYDNIFVQAGSGEFALEGIAVGLIRPTEF
ncbi:MULTISPECIES: transcriptional repressor LexA [Paraburkholderia]|jgi:repressor LexA|uniref:LexA repressor n=2 Tax=Paraburkholderia TaxID=1822464 RepID=A0A9N8RXU4_9BURK|nr:MULTISPECIES: transcriptional repressor LexA [Paraburkholderia]TAL94484.1 MAG: transcriptional repressor LexA [Paraburkholderia sp.]CAG4891641.1 LexA repressor [Paraburkholderia saeva]CAG4895644.1 LexA repressor [Paraburkholderia saeva]CAG4903499.1 LexA repressor [Paraburkholderia saeva]SEA81756.1 SOS-response transcriptional repressor, LexA [Paraburkholderia sartisoli]